MLNDISKKIGLRYQQRITFVPSIELHGAN
jgi:hypothetical protein